MLKDNAKVFESLFWASDMVIISLSWLAAYHIRFYSGIFPLYYVEVPPLKVYLYSLLPIAIIWSFCFKFFGLYRSKRLESIAMEVIDISKACLFSVIVLGAITLFYRQYELSRFVLIIFGFTVTVAVSMERIVLRNAFRMIRKRGFNMRYAAVVGTGKTAMEVAEKLQRYPEVGIEVVGMITGREKAGADHINGVSVLGSYEDIRTIIEEKGINHVIVALGLEEHGRILEVLNNIGSSAVDVKVVPDVYEMITLRGGVEDFDGIPFVSLQDSPLYGWNIFAKRAMDIIISFVAIAVTAPLISLIALLTKVGSKGSVFYRQERVSIGGKRFQMLKFRSMRVDAEDETGPVWASKDDPRRTRLGAFLRKTSLDELPQLFNIIKGEMSLVGPRPERPVFIEKFRDRIPKYMLRHMMKAGLTGWAQVNGLRGDTDIRERINYDLYYIKSWSVAFDLKILLLTMWRGFSNKNAY
jgi:Undecaprenyl-phosphate glucose phosphotransferase